MRIITAITEYIEARTEQLREETAMLHLGKYAEGYKAGQQDLLEGSDLVYVSADDDDEDDD